MKKQTNKFSYKYFTQCDFTSKYWIISHQIIICVYPVHNGWLQLYMSRPALLKLFKCIVKAGWMWWMNIYTYEYSFGWIWIIFTCTKLPRQSLCSWGRIHIHTSITLSSRHCIWCIHLVYRQVADLIQWIHHCERVISMKGELV